MERLKKTLVILLALCMMFSQWTFVQAADKTEAKYVITMDKTVYTMKKGKTVVLKPALNKAARKKKVEWTSSKKNIATVSSKGKVTAKKNGKTTITARIKGTSAKTECKLIVGTPVEKVKLAKSSVTVKAGGYHKVNVTLLPKKPTNKKVIYKSSDNAVVTVTSSGVIKAIKEGEAKITVTAADGTGKKASYKVKVEPKKAKESKDDTDTSNDQKPNTEKPSTGTTSTEKPNTETPSTEKPSTEKPNTETPSTEKPSTEKPSTETPSTEKPSTETPSTEKPSTETPSTEKPSTETPSTEKPSTETPSTEKPSTETPSTEVAVKSVKLSESSISIKVGDQKKLTASVEPANADDKEITWKSSDTKIASVDDKGNITALKEGKITVTATASNGKKASCEVTVSQKDMDAGSRTVTTQDELNQALDVETVKKITYESDVADAITVPSGEYKDKTLEINAPQGDVINNGKFEKVIIYAIASDTYTENTENNIEFKATEGRIVVGSEGSATINLSGSKGQELRLENNGTVNGLNVTTQAALDIQGKNAVPVTLESSAAGTKVDTSVKLNVNSSTSWDMTVLPGAEQTKVTVSNRDCIPSVDGVGCIPVTVRSENTRVNVQARMTNDSRINQTVTVSGKIQEYVKVDGTDKQQESSSAGIYLIPCTSENFDSFNMDAENAGFLVGVQPDTRTDASGNYVLQNIRIGNYWMIVTKDNFKSAVKIISITSDNTNTYSNSNITLLQSGYYASGQADISGTVINGLTGASVKTANIQVELREGNGNIIGQIYKKTVTDSAGKYSFNDVPVGVYTVHVVDLREDLSPTDTVFNQASVDIVVASHLSTNNYNCVVNPQMGNAVGQDQVQFTLTWGTEESGASDDIDSHLWGPAVGGGEYHVWYNERDYRVAGEKMADLDVDDRDYVGPEHTTIYKESSGVYRFYVHNYAELDLPIGSGDMSMLAKSSIQVRVTVGEDTFTYDCPNQEGNLWYVCDYDSTTGRIIKKDVVSTCSTDGEIAGKLMN